MGEARIGEFEYEGYRLEYEEHGSGDRPLILVHGLLLNRGLFTRIAPAVAAAGNRVICLDLLGHGGSDRPEDLQLYSMPLFARQIRALLDHLEIERAVVGGASLGANSALELASESPERVRAMVIEMPVLDDALAGVAAVFAPIFLSLRFGRPLFELLATVTSAVPRSHYLIDLVLDTVRQQPGPSVAVLEGLLLGETAPRKEQRRKLLQRTLIIGHSGDPLHPLSDSDMLADDIVNSKLVDAKSILEWRLRPDRLNRILIDWLDFVWSNPDWEALRAQLA